MPCMCGDSECPSCGDAQGTRAPSQSPADLARAYNALRQKFEEASGSCGEHRCCTELDELRSEFLALPPLPVADVPEVGSPSLTDDPAFVAAMALVHAYLTTDDFLHATPDRQIIKEASTALVAVSKAVAAFRARFRPAPEAGE